MSKENQRRNYRSRNREEEQKTRRKLSDISINIKLIYLIYAFIAIVIVLVISSSISSSKAVSTTGSDLVNLPDDSVATATAYPAAPTPTPFPVAPAWSENLKPPITNSIYLGWDNAPSSLSAVPPGVNVVAPMWFTVKADSDGIPRFVKRNSNDDYEGYIKTARESGAEVWGTIENFDADLSQILVTDITAAQLFVDDINTWLEKYPLQGINFDFEYMDPKNKVKFTEFIEFCKDNLPEDMIISVCVTVPLGYESSTNWWQCYDRAGLAEVADYICVMAYDQQNGTNTMTPVAGIAWVEDKIKLSLLEIPSDKLVMGVPFYGVEYTWDISGGLVSAEPLWYDLKRDPTFRVARFDEALNDGTFLTSGADSQVDYWVTMGKWDAELGITTYEFVDTEGVLHTVWLDDANSLRQKGILINKYNLAGAGVWEMAYGVRQEHLWEALAEAMEVELS